MNEEERHYETIKIILLFHVMDDPKELGSILISNEDYNILKMKNIFYYGEMDGNKAIINVLN